MVKKFGGVNGHDINREMRINRPPPPPKPVVVAEPAAVPAAPVAPPKHKPVFCVIF